MENISLIEHFFYASLATCGFAVFFNTQKKMIIYDGLVGGIGWVAYIVLSREYDNPFIYAFFSAAIVSLCGEILARKLKQAAIVIIIPGILPLIPGIGLYNTVYFIMEKKYVDAATSGTRAFIISTGIALGILVISSLSKFFNLYKLKKTFINNDKLKYVSWVNAGKNRTSNTYEIDKEEMNENLNSMHLDLSEEDPDDDE